MVCEEETRGRVFPTGWSLSSKPCDSCKSSTALLFCRADSAFLCIACDSKIHTANKLASRHERVWMCEVCEQAPASVTCKADAASLCVTCDRDIHSANPLARRHERFPVVPFYESAASVVKSNGVNVNFLVPDTFLKPLDDEEQDDSEEAEAASWLLPTPAVAAAPKIIEGVHEHLKSGDFFFGDVDPFLDLDFGRFQNHQQQQQQHGSGSDSVVPVQNEHHHQQHQHVPVSNPPIVNLDFSRSKASYSYNHSQSVSSSSLDVGVVPDANCNAEISNPFVMNLKTGIENLNAVMAENNNNNGGQGELTNGVQSQQQVCQLSGLDREARVLRYREKRKNRKFEKTIRYASRKAYAETRPRIKGRFAKRTETENEVDQIYSSAAALMVDSGYGIVPSF